MQAVSGRFSGSSGTRNTRVAIGACSGPSDSNVSSSQSDRLRSDVRSPGQESIAGENGRRQACMFACSVSRQVGSTMAAKRMALDPLAVTIRVMFLFPDRSAMLHFLDQLAAGAERFVAVA